MTRSRSYLQFHIHRIWQGLNASIANCELFGRFLISACGYCRFDKREEAQEAIARLHGTIPEGGSEPLSVKIAEEHGKQKAAYYAGWQAGYNQSRGK